MKPDDAVPVSLARLKSAARHAGISEERTDALWAELQGRPEAEARVRFDLEHVAYYFGALVIIGAMGWYMTDAWDYLAGWGLALVASCYGLLFLLIGRRFWNTADRRTPGGLLLTVAVGMVPLAVFGVEKATGFWPAHDPVSFTRFHPLIDGSWVIMEAVTVLVGLLVLRKWKFPFLTAPIAYALWFASMDVPELVWGTRLPAHGKQWITVAFGLVMLAFAYAVDLRRRRIDFAFWGYLFGLAAFWGGLTSMDSASEVGKAVYCLINLGLIFLSVVLRRVVFILFGALGVSCYLCHLAQTIFHDSFAFPFVLSFLGLAIICLGVQYRRRKSVLERAIAAHVLPRLGRWVPPHARGEEAAG